MRKSFKFLTILFAVILLCGVVAVSAMAADENTPNEPEYYFQVYNITTGETVKYENPDDFSAALTGTKDGPKEFVITLLRDIEETESKSIINVGSQASSGNQIKIYWDLNGYYYSLVRKSNDATAVSMDVNDYVELNIYSSRPGGRIFNYNEEGVGSCNALFWLRYSNASLNLGRMDIPVTFNHETGEYSKETTSYDGDNLSTYSKALLGLINRDSNDKNMKVNINGGTYSHSGSGVSLIAISANETDGNEPSLVAKNAKFISAYENLISVNGAATGTSSFDGCTFYSPVSLFNSSSPTHQISFKGCSFIGNVGTLPGNVAVEDCKASSMYAFSQNSEVAHINQTAYIDVTTYNFTYNQDGSVNAGSYNAKTVINEKILYLFQTIGANTEYANITWDAEAVLGEGEKITEKWLIGETPISPIPIPDSTGVYRYAFPGVTEVTADMVGKETTYVLKGYANFGIKANLTLSDSFAFNIYVPADVWSSVNSTKIGGAAEEATATEIDGTDYYLISHPIKANAAKDGFDFVINLDGYNGTSFDQLYTFSIPDYMDRVINGVAYTTQARDLIKATQNYINAVYNYDDAKNESNVIDTTYKPDDKKKGDLKGKFDELTNAELVLGDAIKIRFNANTTVAMTLVVPCQDGTTATTKTITVNDDNWKQNGNVYYYDIALPVRFLNDGIKVTIGNNTATFYLDDYIRYVIENRADDTDLVALVKAIGSYSAAANTYAKTEGNQTPAVNFSVADKEITKIVYNSDAAKATAEKLAEIMTAKGHTVTAVLDTEMAATENAIRISVIDPNPEYDYRMSVDGTNLVIDCSFASFVGQATEYFITDYVKYADKNVNFDEDFTEEYFTAKIYYSDFGAVSVGASATNLNYKEFAAAREGYAEKDAFFAIKATHDFANLTKRHTVYADEDAVYYIHETRRLNEEDGIYGSVQTIQIKTDVNWGNAQFLIDDTDMASGDGTKRTSSRIFNVSSDYASTTITDAATLEKLANIGEGTTKIDYAPGFKALLTIYNSNHKVYRRKGYASAEGDNQHELILIDEDGYVDESTPFMFDYETVTSMKVQRVDENPTTITGGTFYTCASRINMYTPIYANKQAIDPATGALLFDKDAEGNVTTTPTQADKSGYVHYNSSTKQYEVITSWNKDTVDSNVFLTTPNDGYILRSINVSRSNTTLQNVQHYIKYEISVAEQHAGISYTATETITGENGETTVQEIAGSEVKIAYGGSPYNGFLYASNGTDITFKDCVFTGRRGYSKVSNSDDSGMTGTYDFGANLANNITVDGCLQSNFYMQYKEYDSADKANTLPGEVTTQAIWENGKIVGFNTIDDGVAREGYTITYEDGIPKVAPNADSFLSMSSTKSSVGGRMCWGIGGTNYCKNMTYKNSVMSRYDAHCGLLNGQVVGTTINFFAMVGKGDFLIEDVTWITSALSANDEVNNSMIFLRNDYGSPWDGTITIKDTKAEGYATGTTWLIYHSYANWDFGYTAHFPNIIVDNLEFTNTDNVTFLHSNWTDNIHLETYNNATNENTVVPPEFIKIINNNSGENYTMPYSKAFFSSTYFEVYNGTETTPYIQYPEKVEETPTIPVN